MMHQEHCHHLCMKHFHHYCRIKRKGKYYEGYITDVDECSVSLTMPCGDPLVDPPVRVRGFSRPFMRPFFRPRRFPFFEVEEVVPFPFFTQFFVEETLFFVESPFF